MPDQTPPTPTRPPRSNRSSSCQDGQAILAEYGFGGGAADRTRLDAARDAPGGRPLRPPGGAARQVARPPLLAVVLAAVAVAFFALPFIGLLWRVPWGSAWSMLTNHAVGQAAAPVDRVLAGGHGALGAASACPWPGCWPRSPFPGAPPCGRCARCRWCCRPWSAAWRCSSRSDAGDWSASTSTGGSATAIPFTTTAVVLAQTFVAMPFLVLTVEAALRQTRPPLRGGGTLARRLALVHVPAGHAADDPPGVDRRRRARLGPGPR